MLAYITFFIIFLGFIVYNLILIIPMRSVGVIERLGKFRAVLEPGLHFLIPFVDRVAYKHETREQCLNIPDQSCITRDNIQVDVDGLLPLVVLQILHQRKVYDARAVDDDVDRAELQFRLARIAEPAGPARPPSCRPATRLVAGHRANPPQWGSPNFTKFNKIYIFAILAWTVTHYTSSICYMDPTWLHFTQMPFFYLYSIFPF